MPPSSISKYQRSCKQQIFTWQEMEIHPMFSLYLIVLIVQLNDEIMNNYRWESISASIKLFRYS